MKVEQLVAGFLAVLIAAPALSSPKIDNSTWELMASSRAGRTLYQYEYRVSAVNNGSAIPGATAELTSTAPGTVVVEGTVEFGPIGAGESAQSLDTFTIQQDRRLPFDIDALVWTVQAPLAISVEGGDDDLSLEAGASVGKAAVVSISGVGGNAQQVVLIESIEPDNGGLVVNSDAPSGSWATTSDQSWVVNQTLTGVEPGQYHLTTTARLVNTGEEVSALTKVEVTDPLGADVPHINSPGINPDGIAVNQPTEVTFVSDVPLWLEPPIVLVLEEIGVGGTVVREVGMLHDDGVGADAAAGDRFYNGSFSIAAAAEGELRFRVRADLASGSVYSDTTALTVTRFPVGAPPPASPATRSHPETGLEMYLSDIAVSFIDGTSAERIQQIVDTHGYVIAGYLPQFGTYQVRIPGPASLFRALQAIAVLNGYGEVSDARPLYKTGVSAFEPDDDKYDDDHLTLVRADEAWILSRGAGITIAIVDTGVNDEHEDLKDKVVNGYDYVDNDDDPDDEHGHGTHVAGIAGAVGNNGKGIAGLAWAGSIYAVRGIGGSWSQLAEAIEDAADHAHIINISGGGYHDDSDVEDAIDYAEEQGRLVVAAAHNDNREERWYPCAYESVVCVANVNDNDTKAPTSNYGSWVDLSAPGTSVLSAEHDDDEGYRTDGGTSMSTPVVSGAAALVWAAEPGLSADEVRDRLESTAVDIEGNLAEEHQGKMGVGRLDVFEAIFNGSFEAGMSGWERTGTCDALESLGATGQFEPRASGGDKFGYCSTGPAGVQVEAEMMRQIEIQEDIEEFAISFRYDFITEEFPEFVGSQYNDSLEIVLTAPDGSETVLASESVNASNFNEVSDIDFPGGDDTMGHVAKGTKSNDWVCVNETIPVTSGDGAYTISIRDAGDDIYDTVVVIDEIRLEEMTLVEKEDCAPPL
jgi:subtilisin family serine protease